MESLRATTPETAVPAASPGKGSLTTGALGSEFEDPLEPLVPLRKPSQAELNHAEAATLFVVARQHEQRGELVEALRLYERALRLDPGALTIVEHVVSLAFQLDRNDEAVRYAMKAAELNPSDPLLLRQLGLHLSAQGDAAGAVKLYERALEMPELDRESLGFPLLMAELGQLYMQAERHEEAAEAFATVQQRLDGMQETSAPEQRLKKLLLQGLGGEAEAYEQFAVAYLLAERVEDARETLQRAQQAGLSPARLAYQSARLHEQQGEPEQALEQLEAFFQQKSADFGAAPYELLVSIQQAQGEPAAATERLEKLWQEQGDNTPLGLFLAARLGELERQDAAAEIYRALLDREPNATAIGGLLEILRGQQQAAEILEILGEAAATLGSLDIIEAQLEDVLADEALVTALVELALGRLATEPDEAAAQPEPLTFGQSYAAAWIALEAKRYDDAERLFAAALETGEGDSGNLLMDWGVAQLAAARYEQAVEYLTRSLEELEQGTAVPALVRYYLAGALELSEQTDEALEQIELAIQASAEFPRIQPMFYSRKAWIAYHAKRRSLAEETYRQLIEEFDTRDYSPQTRQVLRESRLVLSNLAVVRGDLAEGEEWLEQVLDEFPEDASALNDLGYLWADQGKHLDRALEMVQRAVAAEPENAAYRDSLGWALYRVGRHEEALEQLEKALALTPEPDGVILDHLGDTHFKLGNVELAVEFWTEALEKFSDTTGEDTIQATRKKLREHGPDTDAQEVARGEDAAEPAATP